MIAGQTLSDGVLHSAREMLLERRQTKREAAAKGESETRKAKGRK